MLDLRSRLGIRSMEWFGGILPSPGTASELLGRGEKSKSSVTSRHSPHPTPFDLGIEPPSAPALGSGCLAMSVSAESSGDLGEH